MINLVNGIGNSCQIDTNPQKSHSSLKENMFTRIAKKLAFNSRVNHLINIEESSINNLSLPPVKLIYSELFLWSWIYQSKFKKALASIEELNDYINQEFNLESRHNYYNPHTISYGYLNSILSNINNCFELDSSSNTDFYKNSLEESFMIFFQRKNANSGINKRLLITLICEEKINDFSHDINSFNYRLVKIIRQAIISLLNSKSLNSEDCFFIFKALTEAQNADLKVLAATIDLIKNNFLKHKERFRVFDIYVNNEIFDPKVEKALDQMMLALFADNKILEPKVTEKIINRLVSNKILIEELGYGIVFYEKLFANHKRLLLLLINSHIEYFILRDGVKLVGDTIRHLQNGVSNDSDFIRLLAVELQTKLHFFGQLSC